MARGINGDFSDSCAINLTGGTDNFIHFFNDACSYYVLGDPYGDFTVDTEKNTIFGDYKFFIEVAGQPTLLHKQFNGRKLY
jgi:hypothetical protein